MHLVKGFGKNYFTLRAITAISSQMVLNANAIRIHTFHIIKFIVDDLELQTEDEEMSLCILQEEAKPCHCNCYYLRCTKKTLLLNNSQNRHSTYFKTLNNSISPPVLSPLFH